MTLWLHRALAMTSKELLAKPISPKPVSKRSHNTHLRGLKLTELSMTLGVLLWIDRIPQVGEKARPTMFAWVKEWMDKLSWFSIRPTIMKIQACASMMLLRCNSISWRKVQKQRSEIRLGFKGKTLSMSMLPIYLTNMWNIMTNVRLNLPSSELFPNRKGRASISTRLLVSEITISLDSKLWAKPMRHRLSSYQTKANHLLKWD